MTTTLNTRISAGIYDNYTFSIPAPDGTANIFVAENADGSIYRVDMSIGKAGSSVSAWCNAMSRMVTFALRNTPLEEVILELEDISSDRFQFSDGIPIRSGPEALCVALKRYKLIKKL